MIWYMNTIILYHSILALYVFSLSLSLYMYLDIYIYIHKYISLSLYIYLFVWCFSPGVRPSPRALDMPINIMYIYIYICMHICLCVYIYRDCNREMVWHISSPWVSGGFMNSLGSPRSKVAWFAPRLVGARHADRAWRPEMFAPGAAERATDCLSGFDVPLSEGGMLKFIDSSFSSANFSNLFVRAYPLVEIRQVAPCRAMQGESTSVNSTPPPSYSRHLTCTLPMAFWGPANPQHVSTYMYIYIYIYIYI